MNTLKELRFFLKADAIMNEQVFPQSFFRRIIYPCNIERFLRCLRILEYLFDQKKKKKLWSYPLWLYYGHKYHILSQKLGFYIPINTVGYGCRIAHQCGIIINGNTKVGNYCCLYRCSCADGNPKKIGNNVFIGTNVVITGNVSIADGTTISAMSMVNKDIANCNELWGGGNC